MNTLEILLLLPLCGFVISMLSVEKAKIVSLYWSFFIVIYSLFLWIKFDEFGGGFQFVRYGIGLNSINVYYCIGIDGISVVLLILTAILIPLCILCSWTSVIYRVKEFLVLLFLIEFLLFQVFTVMDLVLFYIFFESVLIPMFLLIGVWGSRVRKIHAAYQFFMYTLIGSLFMLLGVLLLYFQCGSTNLYVLLANELTYYREIIVWFSLFISFAIKVPVIPFHIWLPEAHVEAPTAGSVLLAGILLKMGTYAMLRFLVTVLPNGTNYFIPLVYTISVISIIYSSCSTIRQIDIKKTIAYSSVAHMNFVTLGIMSNNSAGIEGSVYLMLGHGIVSSALFICIGVLYERYHTRVINYYGGLCYVMPLFALIFFLFTLGNVSLPGTSNFVGELLVIIGAGLRSPFVVLLAGSGVVLGAVYAFWLYNRIVFGQVRSVYLKGFCDITRREFYVLIPLVLSMFLLGLYPSSISVLISEPVSELLLKVL